MIGTLAMSVGIAEGSGSGMTARQAFADEHVVKFVEAVARGRYAAADLEIKAGANVNAVGTDGISPLFGVMGETLDTDRLEYLLKKGADPNYREPKHQASVMYIAAGGDHTTKVLELLLWYKGDPNLLAPDGEPPLLTAVQENRGDNIKLLVRYGADVNWADHHGSTAASKAASYAQFDMVLFFLDHGLNSHLEQLAGKLQYVVVPANSGAERGKEKVIEILKARGVRFPSPKKSRTQD